MWLRVYLDTSIILDYLLERNQASLKFIDEFCKKHEITVVITPLTLSEALGGLKERFLLIKLYKEGYSIEEIIRIRRDRDLAERETRKLLEKLQLFYKEDIKEFSELVAFATDHEKLLNIMAKTCLEAADALHLFNAIEAKCDVFLTRDIPAITKINKSRLITAYTPEELLEKYFRSS